MKKETITTISEEDFVRKLTTTLNKEIGILDELVDTSNEYIKIISPSCKDIVFIRLVSTPNYFNKTVDMNFVNIYVMYKDDVNKEHNALLNSFMYIEDYFAIFMKEVLILIYNKIFKFEDNCENNVTIIVGSGTRTYVNLNKSFPKALKDKDSLISFLQHLGSELSNHNPAFDIQFHCNVNGVEVEPNNTLCQDGSFFISFNYDSNLSYRFRSNIIHIYGELPSISSNTGIAQMCNIVDIDKYDDLYNILEPALHWYFSLRGATLQNESIDVYISAIPYFQEII